MFSEDRRLRSGPVAALTSLPNAPTFPEISLGRGG